MLYKFIGSMNLTNSLVFSFLFLSSFFNQAFALDSTITASEGKSKVIYLVRHAEKAKSKEADPTLTKVGIRRANNIAKMLKDEKITQIYSTSYKRTMGTAKPLAELLKLNIEQYDPRNLKEFAKKILSLSDHSLIVGHSNTTPEMVKLLGGDAGQKMTESDYDRVYKLMFKQGSISTQLLKSSAN